MELSTFGCPSCREEFRKVLVEYYSGRKDGLCCDCMRRLERNVFRLLDCKEERCRAMAMEAPTIEGFLDASCREHFAVVQDMLCALGVKFVLNMRLVRGLDYYNGTIFEFFPFDEGGRQDALGAGGRYDGLGEILGGPRVPAVGFALGVDRIALALAASQLREQHVEVYIAAKPGAARVLAPVLAQELRRKGFSCVVDIAQRQLDAQLKEAADMGARWAVLLGINETARLAVLRDLRTGQQGEYGLGVLADEIVRRRVEIIQPS